MAELIHVPRFQRLQDAMARISASLGNGTHAEGLVQGLPLQEGRLAATFLQPVAERAGLIAQRIALSKAKPYHCPLLLTYQDGQVAVLAQINPVGTGVAITPAGQTQDVLLASLTQGLTDCWSLAPAQESDAQAAGLEQESQRHWLMRAMFMQRDVLPAVITATIVINILALAVPLITMNVMDRVVTHSAFDTLWALVLGGVIAVVADFILRSLRGQLVDRSGVRSDVAVANAIFGKVLGTALVARPQSVGVQSNTLREYESLRDISNAATLAALGDMPFAILFLLTIYAVAGALVWVPLVVMPLLLLVGWLSQSRQHDIAVEHFRDTAQKNAVAVEMLSNLESIKLRAAESWAAAKWERAVAAHLRHSLALRWHMLLGGNAMLALQGLTTLAVLVAGVYLIADKQMSPGALFAATMLTGRALSPVSQLASLISKFHHATSAYGALRKLVDAPQERPQDMRFLSPPQQFRAIALEKVSLSYAAQASPVLEDISLTVRAGEKIAIIGAVGCGKSSLLRLLLGLRPPTAGSISMDGIPLSQLDPALYRLKFGCAFREEGFFQGSLRQNIAFHRPAASDADMIAAATMSGAMEWIKHLPKGLDSLIGEAGTGLSSGQRQTLALARAFVGQPDIHLLDEPTSDVDGRSEQAFVQRLQQLPPHITMIVVTHRPAVIEACNRLIVMDKGRILMDDATPVVLARLRQQNRAAEAVA